MPGKIVSVLVQVGQAVSRGTEVLVHEAMKMENTIFADCEGIVSDIKVKAGDSVEISQPLITLS